MAVLPTQFGSSPQAFGNALNDLGNTIGHLLAHVLGPGTHGARHVGTAGNDVARAAAMDFADGQNGGLEGRDIAADQHLQGHHQLGGNHHGVDALVGHGPVRARTFDIDAEPVGIGHARTGLAAYGAGVDLTPDVCGVGAIDAVEHTRADHEFGALAVFLTGLEDDADLAVDVVGHMAQDLQRAEHHGNVAVVAAGVHAALVDAGELLAGLFGDG